MIYYSLLSHTLFFSYLATSKWGVFFFYRNLFSASCRTGLVGISSFNCCLSEKKTLSLLQFWMIIKLGRIFLEVFSILVLWIEPGIPSWLVEFLLRNLLIVIWKFPSTQFFATRFSPYLSFFHLNFNMPWCSIVFVYFVWTLWTFLIWMSSSCPILEVLSY